MKGSKRLTIVLLIVLLIVGWGFTALGILDGRSKDDTSTEQYSRLQAMGEDYMARALYQKAIEVYTAAAKQKNLESDYELLLNAYESRYQEDEGIREEYLSAAKTASKAHRSNIAFATRVAELAILEDQYETAFSYLDDTLKTGVTDPALLEFYKKVLYAVDVISTTYDAYYPLSEKTYTVSRDGLWGIIKEDGGKKLANKFQNAGPVSKEGFFGFTNDLMSGLMDEQQVVQGRYSFTPEEFGFYGEGLMPLKKDGKWGYYTTVGDYAFGEYLMAGRVTGGKAAVQKMDGSWCIITIVKNAVTEESKPFSDIVLNTDGSYLVKNLMAAAEGGKYHIYNEKLEVVGSFEADGMDRISVDGFTAFRKGELWGFVDSEGNVKMEAKYEGAKSFSNGVAGVENDSEWTFINPEGESLFDETFTNVDYMNRKGLCMVEMGLGNWQLMQRKVVK